MRYLKQSTAATFRIGPFVDETDGKTAETALTLSRADYRLSKAGGAFAQKTETTSGSHDENGWYTCILDTTDTNTLGSLDIAVHESGALPVFVHCTVLAANIYDSLIGGGDTLDVQVTGMAADTLSASALATDAVTEIQSGLATAANLSTVAGYLDTEIAAILADTNELQTDWVNGGRLDLLIDAIKAKTDNLPSSTAVTAIAEAVWEASIAVADQTTALPARTARRSLMQIWQDIVKR